MSEPKRPKKPTSRLVNLVVNEVSLVDLGANLEKWMIMKRADNTGTQHEPEGESATPEPKDDAAAQETGSGTTFDALGEATDALESLTGIVERLSAGVAKPGDKSGGSDTTCSDTAGSSAEPAKDDVDDVDKDGQLDLGLNGSGGGEETSTSSPAAPDVAAADTRALQDALASFRQITSQLDSLLPQSQQSAAPPDGSASSPQGGVAASAPSNIQQSAAPSDGSASSPQGGVAASAPTAEIARHLERVTKSLGVLAERLGTIEKRFREPLLPNSASEDLNPARAQETDWPWDLNAPDDADDYV